MAPLHGEKIMCIIKDNKREIYIQHRFHTFIRYMGGNVEQNITGKLKFYMKK